jgi:AcrR family transcriptional regulator
MKESFKGTESSRQKISNALLSLSQKNKYVDISITEIAVKARVTRKTFYNSFNSKEDVIRYQIYDVMNRFFAMNNVESLELVEIFERVYAFALGYKSVLLTFYENRLFFMAANYAAQYILQSKIYTKFRDVILKDWYYAYLPYQITNAIFNIAHHWVRNNFKQTPQELAEYTTDLFFGRVFKDDVKRG